MVDQLHPAVGDEAGHQDLAAHGDDLEQPVPDVLHAFGEAAGEEEQDQEQAGAREHELVLGVRVAQHLDQPDAHEHAADGAQAADHGHGEDDQPVRGVEGVEGDGAQQHGVEPAGDAGDGARQHEAGQLGAHRRHRHGGGRLLVVPGRQQDPSRSGSAQALDEEDGQDEEAEAEEVEGLVGRQVEALPQHRPQEGLRDDVRVVGGVEEEGVHGHPQGQGHRRQIGPADAQGGDSDDHCQHCTGPAGGGQAEEQVRVRLLYEVARQHAADAREGELAQAHVAGPPGQHHEREGDDPVDEGGGVLERRPRAGHQGDHDDHHGHHHEQADPPGHDLGQLAERFGDGLEDAGGREGLLGVVGPAPLALQEEQAQEDRHQVDDVADGAAVAGHVELEQAARDAEGHPRPEGQGQALHAGDDGRGQCGEDEGRACSRRDGDAGGRGTQDARQAGQDAGDHPHQGRQAADRDPEQPGAVGVVGDRAHRDAGVGPQQEPAQGDEYDGHHNGDEEVVPVEEHREDQHVLRAQWRVDAAHDGRSTQPARHQQLDAPEELGQPDRDHHDDQAWRGEEPPADDAVHDETEGGSHHERDPDAHEPVDVVGQVELDGDRGRQRTHGAVREVDHPRRPVGEDETEGEQAVHGTELGSVEDLAARRCVGPQRRDGDEEDEDRGDRQDGAAQPRRRAGPGVADGGREGETHGRPTRHSARSGSSTAAAAPRRRTSRSCCASSQRRRSPSCRCRATSSSGSNR